MASFDYETFLTVQGLGGKGAFKALGMSFGLPSCLLNYGSNVLNLLPSDVLGDMKLSALQGKLKAQEATSWVLKKLFLDKGIIEFDTNTGTFKFKSASSLFGLDSDGNALLTNLNALVGAFNYASAFGAQIYKNYTDIGNQIDAALDCLDKYQSLKSFERGNSANQINNLGLTADDLYEAEKKTVTDAVAFANQVDNLVNNIDGILSARAKDPSREPEFLDTVDLDTFLSGTSYSRSAQEDPTLRDEFVEGVDGVFRLVYGPPISTKGKYLLTSDGLYYDSQKGGLDPVFLAISGTIPPGDKWKFEYDPNLGGKGESITGSKLDQYKDTLFDPDIVDDSLTLTEYYDADHFLQTLKQQRDKHIYDLSGTLQELIADPSYGEDSSVVKNLRQGIISEIANHNSKVSRRKKQIEVAVKAPVLFSRVGQENEPFKPGEIPINDFSFLKDYNFSVSINKQKALIFEHAEVDGIALPIKPKFVTSPGSTEAIHLDQLNVPPVGKGSILYTPSGGAGSGTMLSLTDSIVTKDLFAIYNFLETDVVLPSSLDFFTTNCATEDTYNNAQLVAPNASSVFFSGLGIPYFEGITKNSTTFTSATSSLGTFVKLPDTREFRDLTYNMDGFTIEGWVHMPFLDDHLRGWGSADVSSLTRAIIACENTGHKPGTPLSSTDLDKLPPVFGDNYVRGLVCGFTRDRRITQEDVGFSNSNGDNLPTSSLSFFIAPTQSRDFSSLSWVNNTDCQNGLGFHKMKVDCSTVVSNIKYGDASSSFVQIAVSVNPRKNEVSMHLDGKLMAVSSVDSVFGKKAFGPIDLPSFKKENSFYYTASNVNGPLSIRNGPDLYDYFTPYIVGGGFTDGMYAYGNFMGGDRGGIISGLKGFLGSLKFYNKALDTGSIRKNYLAQQGFFKNIQT